MRASSVSLSSSSDGIERSSYTRDLSLGRGAARVPRWSTARAVLRLDAPRRTRTYRRILPRTGASFRHVGCETPGVASDSKRTPPRAAPPRPPARAGALPPLAPKAAKTAAKAENRALVDGALQPACAQACPTSAIIFGDLNDPNSRVAKLAKSPRGTRLLEDLGAEPKITYLQKLPWNESHTY